MVKMFFLSFFFFFQQASSTLPQSLIGFMKQHFTPGSSLVPSPHPAFRRLQYGKVGSPFSHENDEIDNWQNEKANFNSNCHYGDCHTHQALNV